MQWCCFSPPDVVLGIANWKLYNTACKLLQDWRCRVQSFANVDPFDCGWIFYKTPTGFEKSDRNSYRLPRGWMVSSPRSNGSSLTLPSISGILNSWV